MRDVKLTYLADGCSILAKTSRGRNKTLPKVSPEFVALADIGPGVLTKNSRKPCQLDC